MKVQSFTRDQNQLVPVEVELTLWPGLPTIQFLGLPDQHLKESALRIKSALKSAGYEFPQASQILVNLRPSYLKKSSRGIELAVAAAYLWETQQVAPPKAAENMFVYGELGLDGVVTEPNDLSEDLFMDQVSVLTGPSSRAGRISKFIINNLKDLESPVAVLADQNSHRLERPTEFQDFLFTREQATALKIIVLGGHSALLAGPSGSGKSTLGRAIVEFLPPPEPEERESLYKTARLFGGESIKWRPLVAPHHTTPIMSMIGGGAAPAAGEISRAHGGVLLLDELLEYHPAVMEALRGPMENGRISVARKGSVINYPCQATVVATTNLCPCGDWVPGQKSQSGLFRCRFSLKKCRSYSQRLSGPIADRFEIMLFTKKNSQSEFSGAQLLRVISEVRSFQESRQKKSEELKGNAGLNLVDFQAEKNWPEIELLLPSFFSSQRRKLATLRVARTLADIEFSHLIKAKHLQEALEWTYLPFEELRNS